MGVLGGAVKEVGRRLGPPPYVPPIWDLASVMAGVLFMMGYWYLGTPLLVLAAAASWRLLALATWSPMSVADQGRAGGGTARRRGWASGFDALGLGALCTFGVANRLSPSATAFLAGVTVATLLFRPRWVVVAARWLMPLTGGAGVVGLLFDETDWRIVALTSLALACALRSVRPAASPGLPSFRQCLGLQEDGRSARGSERGVSPP